jgi:hypothetical protein
MTPLRLIDLDPEWITDYDAGAHSMRRKHDLAHAVSDASADGHGSTDLQHAQGVMFLCPVCFVKNGGAVGTESVLCWFKDRGVPADALPGPGRWTCTGTSFADLTLSPSVNVDDGHWHGWVQNGEVK